ncbi:MAG: HD domain-containing protein [Epsilonproteobacteria bacterium]|nr:HD domain-containing protein [Campylobacterota bacterium]
MKDKALYSSRIINTYLKLIKRNYSYINIKELLNYAGMELYQVTDEGHWFTQKQVDLFYERLEKLTGNKNIAREAGKYSASPDVIGAMRQYILGFTGPAKAYEIVGLVGQYARNFTRSSVYESKRIASNKVEITVTPKEGVREKPYQCENRLGFWDAIALLFNYRLPKIEHPECIFRGDNCCRYIISWRESHSVLWKSIRNYAVLVLSAISAGTYFIYPDIAVYSLLASIFIVLGITLHREILKNKELNNAVTSLKDSSEKLVDRIDSNYSNALMLNEIGQTLNSHVSMDKILSEVIKILERRLGYDRGIILLANNDKTLLNFYIGFGYTDEQFSLLKDTDFHIDRPESRGVFVDSFREKKPILINDVNEIETTLSLRSLAFMKKMVTKSFICCPITYENQPLGILAADNVKTKRPLRQSDVNLLMSIAPHIGISINNARISEAKDRQFQSILKTLAASIDARDFLTAGHSERVAEYSVGICNEIDMSKEYTEMIRVASLLHDYGKIGVSDNVLKKNGPLTKEEYEEIKTHAEKTEAILKQFNFEGIYKEVSIVAGSHHEKLDGSGYPRGLKNAEIPLGAKIIGVADFFEALTSRRHYREAMPSNKAFDLLNDASGKQFDENIVKALISYYNKNCFN